MTFPTTWSSVPEAEEWLLHCKARLRELDFQLNQAVPFTVDPNAPVYIRWKERNRHMFNAYRASKKRVLTWLRYHKVSAVARSLHDILAHEDASPERDALRTALSAYLNMRQACSADSISVPGEGES